MIIFMLARRFNSLRESLRSARLLVLTGATRFSSESEANPDRIEPAYVRVTIDAVQPCGQGEPFRSGLLFHCAKSGIPLRKIRYCPNSDLLALLMFALS
jgi:hypothetical protein